MVAKIKSNVSLPNALLLLRVVVPIFFLAHAVVRIVNGSIPSFSNYLAHCGLPFPTALVWLISVYEITASACIALGFAVRWWASGLIFIVAVGIGLIHWQFGWFVGEHGTGGMEYSVSLIVSLIVLIAADLDQANQGLLDRHTAQYPG
jgi:putative oxidoreductase